MAKNESKSSLILKNAAESGNTERSVAALKAIGMIRMGTELGYGIFFGLGALGFFIMLGLV